MTFHLGWNKPDRDTFHIGWLADVEETVRPPSGTFGGYHPSKYAEGEDFGERWRRDREEEEKKRKQAVRLAFGEVAPDLTEPLKAEDRTEVAAIAREEIQNIALIEELSMLEMQTAELLALIDQIWLEMQEEEALALLLLSM